jgi:heat shock protein HslJ
MRRAIAFIVITAVLLAGCAGVSAGPSSTLAGTAWKLDSWSEGAINPQDFTITASFADGRVAGKAAVNNFFAGYTEGPDGKFTVSRAGSTMMAGPPAAMQAEKTYLKLLEQVQAYTRTDEKLTLADGSGQPLLVFVPAPAKP